MKRTATIFAAMASLAFASPTFAQVGTASSDVESYYARRSSPLWFSSGAPTAAANALPSILRRAQVDGLVTGPVLAMQVELAIRTAAQDPGLAMQMDRVLSSAWVRYVQALEAPMPGFEYGDEWRPPRTENAIDILNRGAESQQLLLQQVLKTASVNPVYSALRDAAWNGSLSSGNAPSAAILANLARVRILPPPGKFLLVDARGARLFMFDQGQLVDSMRVIAGKPETPTPLVVGTIYEVTLNPYWNVPEDLVRRLIAPRVLAQGGAYLKDHHYQLVTRYDSAATELSPASVDWNAIADGRAQVLVRQLPGPANSMGKLKFGFYNAEEIYLHDTPDKALFQEKERLLSNGCIRLEDAQRLGRWLLDRDPQTGSTEPDTHQRLAQPVPIYVTYLTVRADDGKLELIADIYGRDPVERAPEPPGRP